MRKGLRIWVLKSRKFMEIRTLWVVFWPIICVLWISFFHKLLCLEFEKLGHIGLYIYFQKLPRSEIKPASEGEIKSKWNILLKENTLKIACDWQNLEIFGVNLLYDELEVSWLSLKLSKLIYLALGKIWLFPFYANYGFYQK